MLDAKKADPDIDKKCYLFYANLHLPLGRGIRY